MTTDTDFQRAMAEAFDPTPDDGELTIDARSGQISLPLSVAGWIEDLLLYLYRWFEEDEAVLEDDLEAWTGGGPCRMADLITDLDRAISSLRPEPQETKDFS